MTPERMPMFRGGRPLKRWRYVAALSPSVMACVADVRIGPLPVRFYALAEPDGAIATATPLSPRAIRVEGSHARVRTRHVALDIAVDERDGIATWHGDVWTRKQAGVPARLVATVDGSRAHELDCRAVVDDTAGYHPRHTRWLWSAGVGRSADGRNVAWNLVSGVNDEPHGSERAIWVEGDAHEPGPVVFADDLSRVEFTGGGALRFDAWAERSADVNLVVVRSRYRQPFGSFRGELPGVGPLAEGYGVMEWHDARW